MNTDKIQDIIRVFEESGLHKMELEVDDMKIKMEKGAAADSRAAHMEPGNANTCNANGEEIANRMCELCAQELNLNAEDIIVASTAVTIKSSAYRTKLIWS